MNIEIKDTLTLNDNNNYLVISKINYNSYKYYYLIDEQNNENIKFCYEEDNKFLVEISDENLIQKLLYEFLKVISTNIIQ